MLSAFMLAGMLALSPEAKGADNDPGYVHHALEQKTLGFYAVFPPRNYAEGVRQGKKYALCVILHGLGSNEINHGSLALALNLDDVLYVAPRAPFPHQRTFLENNVPGWTAWPPYPSEWGDVGAKQFPAREIQDLDPARLYLDWIAACVRDVRKRYSVREGKVVVLGHSQGAGFAHRFAVAYPELVKAYIAYAGKYSAKYANPPEVDEARILTENGILPFILHCEADSVVSVEESRRLLRYFDEHGVKCERMFFPGGSHSIGSQPLAEMRRFLSRQSLNRDPPKLEGYVMIGRVDKQTQAQNLGLRIGDRIVGYNKRRVRNKDELLEAIKAAKGLKAVEMTIERDGAPLPVKLAPGTIGVAMYDR